MALPKCMYTLNYITNGKNHIFSNGKLYKQYVCNMIMCNMRLNKQGGVKLRHMLASYGQRHKNGLKQDLPKTSNVHSSTQPSLFVLIMKHQRRNKVSNIPYFIGPNFMQESLLQLAIQIETTPQYSSIFQIFCMPIYKKTD